MPTAQFDWDEKKNETNQKMHSLSFQEAQAAFFDANRVIAQEADHSRNEERFYCFGKVEGGVLTVRFTYRGNQIRTIGAGFWRKGKQIYDKENNLHG